VGREVAKVQRDHSETTRMNNPICCL